MVRLAAGNSVRTFSRPFQKRMGCSALRDHYQPNADRAFRRRRRFNPRARAWFRNPRLGLAGLHFPTHNLDDDCRNSGFGLKADPEESLVLFPDFSGQLEIRRAKIRKPKLMLINTNQQELITRSGIDCAKGGFIEFPDQASATGRNKSGRNKSGAVQCVRLE